MAVGTKTKGAGKHKGTTACSNFERETAKTTEKKLQPKGAKIKKSKNNGKPPNETFFFIVVPAEGKVERT